MHNIYFFKKKLFWKTDQEMFCLKSLLKETQPERSSGCACLLQVVISQQQEVRNSLFRFNPALNSTRMEY